METPTHPTGRDQQKRTAEEREPLNRPNRQGQEQVAAQEAELGRQSGVMVAQNKPAQTSPVTHEPLHADGQLTPGVIAKNPHLHTPKVGHTSVTTPPTLTGTAGCTR